MFQDHRADEHGNAIPNVTTVAPARVKTTRAKSRKSEKVIAMPAQATLVPLRDAKGKIVYFGVDDLNNPIQRKSVFPAGVLDLDAFIPMNHHKGIASHEEPIAYFVRRDGFKHIDSHDFGMKKKLTPEDVIAAARRNMAQVKRLSTDGLFHECLVNTFNEQRNRFIEARERLYRRVRIAIAAVSMMFESAPSLNNGPRAADTHEVQEPECATVLPAPVVVLEQPGLDEQSTLISGYTDKQVIDFITAHEGEERNMYQDARGVSVGRGHFLMNVNAAYRLPFVTQRADGSERPATRAEISAAYYAAKVTIVPRARRNPTINRVYLNPTDLAALTLKDVKALSVEEARRIFPHFDRMPPAAQLAMAEEMYNRGGNSYNPGNDRTHFAALRRGDWATAARTSQVGAIGRDRKRDRAAMFRAAAGPRPSADLAMTQARMAREARNLARTPDATIMVNGGVVNVSFGNAANIPAAYRNCKPRVAAPASQVAMAQTPTQIALAAHRRQRAAAFQ